MQWLSLVFVLWGCGSWWSVEPNSLAHHERDSRMKRVFVVMETEAFDMYLTDSDATTLRGDVVHAWIVPTAADVIYVDEQPADIASRLGWKPRYKIPERVFVPIDAVRHARARGRSRHAASIAVAVGALFVVGIATGVYLGSELAAGWNETE